MVRLYTGPGPSETFFFSMKNLGKCRPLHKPNQISTNVQASQLAFECPWNVPNQLPAPLNATWLTLITYPQAIAYHSSLGCLPTPSLLLWQVAFPDEPTLIWTSSLSTRPRSTLSTPYPLGHGTESSLCACLSSRLGVKIMDFLLSLSP
jgi:hypothetical protein